MLTHLQVQIHFLSPLRYISKMDAIADITGLQFHLQVPQSDDHFHHMYIHLNPGLANHKNSMRCAAKVKETKKVEPDRKRKQIKEPVSKEKKGASKPRKKAAVTKTQSSDDDSEQEFIPQHASKRSPVQKESARKTTAAGQVNLSDLGAINNIIMGNFEIMSKHFHHERAEKPIAQPEISPVESVKKSPDSSPADQLLILNSLAGILRGFPGAHAA